MPQYHVEVPGSMTWHVDIEAANPTEALGKAQALFDEGLEPVTLEAEHFDPEWKDGSVWDDTGTQHEGLHVTTADSKPISVAVAAAIGETLSAASDQH